MYCKLVVRFGEAHPVPCAACRATVTRGQADYLGEEDAEMNIMFAALCFGIAIFEAVYPFFTKGITRPWATAFLWYTAGVYWLNKDSK